MVVRTANKVKARMDIAQSEIIGSLGMRVGKLLIFQDHEIS